MFGKRKLREKIIELESEVRLLNENLKKSNESSNYLLKSGISKENKIKELMTSVQALNRDLDRWEPLADLIGSIDIGLKGKVVGIPKKGIIIFNEYKEQNGKR